MSNLQWEEFKWAIQDLYITQNLPLEGPGGVIDFMGQQHGFMASKAQYERRIKKWGFRKYAKGAEPKDWQIIRRKAELARKQSGKYPRVYHQKKLLSIRVINQRGYTTRLEDIAFDQAPSPKTPPGFRISRGNAPDSPVVTSPSNLITVPPIQQPTLFTTQFPKEQNQMESAAMMWNTPSKQPRSILGLSTLVAYKTDSLSEPQKNQCPNPFIQEHDLGPAIPGGFPFIETSVNNGKSLGPMQITRAPSAGKSSPDQEMQPPILERLYRLCLEGIPWYRFINMLRRKCLGIAQTQENQQANTYTARFGYQLDSIDLFSVSNLSNIHELSFPSIWSVDVERWTPFPTELNPNFNPYLFLASAVYMLSNDLISVNNQRSQCSEIVSILYSQIPRKLLLRLFKSPLPSIRATWEKLVEISVYLGHRDIFLLIMRAGLGYREWISSKGHAYLSYAGAMDCLDVVHDILKIGIRPDQKLFQTHDEVRYFVAPAIIEAAAVGSLDCVRLLIENCDVNKPILNSGVSNFDLFLAALLRQSALASCRGKGSSRYFCIYFQFSNELHCQILDMFLANGANVDAPLKWSGDLFWDDWDPLHTKLIQNHCRTLLEHTFYQSRALFNYLAPFSLTPMSQLTRHGACLAAQRGRGALNDYLVSRSPQDLDNQNQLLQLVLLEQFVGKEHIFDIHIVQALVDIEVDVRIPLIFDASEDILSHVVDNIRRHGFTENSAEFLALLIRKGALVNPGVINMAIEADGIAILKLLARSGISFRGQGALGLATAASVNNLEAVAWLLGSGVDINSLVYSHELSTELGFLKPWAPLSILAIAASDRCHDPSPVPYLRRQSAANYNTTKYLINQGALSSLCLDKLDYFEFIGFMLSHLPRDDELIPKVKLLLTGGDLRNPSSSRARLLEKCLLMNIRWYCLSREEIHHFKQRSLQLFEWLFSQGAPAWPGSSLALAIRYGCEHALVHKILGTRADINAYPGRFPGLEVAQLTPVQAAASRGDYELIKLLLERGADINKPAIGDYGRTALQAACEWRPASAEEERRKIDVLRLLLGHGADVNAPRSRCLGYTALHIAASQGFIEVAVLLLLHKANPNIPPSGTGYGSTSSPLDLAAEFGRLDMVKFLLNVGAFSYDRGLTGYDGAIRAAEENGKLHIVDFIHSHMEDDIRFGVESKLEML